MNTLSVIVLVSVIGCGCFFLGRWSKILDDWYFKFWFYKRPYWYWRPKFIREPGPCYLIGWMMFGCSWEKINRD